MSDLAHRCVCMCGCEELKRFDLRQDTDALIPVCIGSLLGNDRRWRKRRTEEGFLIRGQSLQKASGHHKPILLKTKSILSIVRKDS